MTCIDFYSWIFGVARAGNATWKLFRLYAFGWRNKYINNRCLFMHFLSLSQAHSLENDKKARINCEAVLFVNPYGDVNNLIFPHWWNNFLITFWTRERNLNGKWNNELHNKSFTAEHVPAIKLEAKLSECKFFFISLWQSSLVMKSKKDRKEEVQECAVFEIVFLKQSDEDKHNFRLGFNRGVDGKLWINPLSSRARHGAKDEKENSGELCQVQFRRRFDMHK